MQFLPGVNYSADYIAIFKVALNPLPPHADYNLIIKNGGHRARFEVISA